MRRRLLPAALVMAVSLVFAWGSTANAVGEKPSYVTGSGSDVAWKVMTNLDTLYDLSPGCNLLSTGTQPLDQSCQAAFPGTTPPTSENAFHDVVREEAPIGGTAGVSELCQHGLAGIAPVDFARQTKAPSSSTCTGTSFVAYARDGLAVEAWPGIAGSGTSTFHNTSGTCAGSTGFCLTQAQLQGIFVTCSITNWNQVGGLNVKIVPYVPLPQFGTRSAWDTLLGGDTSHCITNPNHITPAETDNSFPAHDGTRKGAIMAVSYASWKTRYGGKTNNDGSKLASVDKVAAGPVNIGNGSYPYGRFIYNVYCTACGSGPFVSSAATVRYVGEEGWICKASTHVNVPFTTTNYRTAITNAIKAAGFVPLPLGVIGGGDTNSDYCRLTTH